MAELVQDYNFELNGVVFGIDQKVSCNEDGFKPGDPDITMSSAPNPTGHGTLPGRDYRGSATWGFDLHVDAETVTEALSTLAELRSAWWHESTEDTPGAFDTLRYRLDGRTRQIHGRARRWTPAIGNRLMHGYLPITADFEQMDPFIYDDAEESTKVGFYGSPPAAGLQGPLESPLISEGGGDVVQLGEVWVKGETPTWIELEFYGSQVNPWVTLGNWRFELNDTIGSEEKVMVDPRPLARTVLRQRGDRPGGRARISNTTRLGVMSLAPGRYTIGYGALSADGSAGVIARWHNAYKSI